MSWTKLCRRCARGPSPSTGRSTGLVRSARRSSWPSASPSSSSCRTLSSASASLAPRATSDRKRSSRCCASSSMTASCRVGSSCRAIMRLLTTAFQSRMASLRDAVDGGDEAAPALALVGEDAAAFAGQAVVAAAALAFLFHPLPGDPAAALEPVEQGIERRDLEPHGALRALLDHLADLVAVAGSRFDEREDDELGAAF